MRIMLQCVLLALLISFSAKPLLANTAPFSIEISTQKSSVKSGQEVKIHVVLTNTSGLPLAVTGALHQGVYYSVRVINENGMPPPSKESDPHKYTVKINPGALVIKHLKPGDAEEATVRLNDLYDITIPGTYLVRVNRSVEEGDSKGTVVQSNLIRLTVTQ
jgi:hypothetical protein